MHIREVDCVSSGPSKERRVERFSTYTPDISGRVWRESSFTGFIIYIIYIYNNFPLRISSVNVTKSAETAYLVTFAEETLNGKCHFL